MPRNLKSGVYQAEIARNEPDPDSRVADFAYENDSLAELIVQAWSDKDLERALTSGSGDARSSEAKRVLHDRGIYLTRPIVITEAEYDGGFIWPPDDGVVFVLPNKERTSKTPANQSLLETAKFLMSYVPNGI